MEQFELEDSVISVFVTVVTWRRQKWIFLLDMKNLFMQSNMDNTLGVISMVINYEVIVGVLNKWLIYLNVDIDPHRSCLPVSILIHSEAVYPNIDPYSVRNPEFPSGCGSDSP